MRLKSTQIHLSGGFVTFSELLQIISNHIHFGITHKSTEQKNYPVSRGFFPVGVHGSQHLQSH